MLRVFFGRVKAGRLEDGTANVSPFIAYGDARFSASAVGRRAGPTSAVYHAAVHVFGYGRVFLTAEHRSTRCCACCSATP